MNDRVQRVTSMLIGSLLIASGSAMAGISSFNNQVGLVGLGFIIFVAGYAISQRGLHANESVLQLISDESKSMGSVMLQVTLLGAGIVFISLGVTLFSQTILNPDVKNAALSGISSIGGYMIAHVGINRSGMGESLIYDPIRIIITMFRERM